MRMTFDIFIDEWWKAPTHGRMDDVELWFCGITRLIKLVFDPIYSAFRVTVCREFRNNLIWILLKFLFLCWRFEFQLESFFLFSKLFHKITTFLSVQTHTEVETYIVWYCISCWRDCLRGRNCCFFFVSSGANPLYDDSIVNRWNSKNRMKSECVCAI